MQIITNESKEEKNQARGKINKRDIAEEITEWRYIEVIRRTRQRKCLLRRQRKRCVSRDLKMDKDTAVGLSGTSASRDARRQRGERARGEARQAGPQGEGRIAVRLLSKGSQK